jgi:hypothetical protein
MKNNEIKKTYIPAPVDTSDVTLSEEILSLATLLARNTHDVWSQGRIAQGWTYGEQRNDERKETPCLLDFEELSADEQSYDYNTALETLKVMVKLGWRILPPEE